MVRKHAPTFQVALGALLISFSPVFVKAAHSGPATTAFYRLFIGGLVLAAVAAVRGRKRRVARKTIGLASLCGLIIALDLTVWHESIRLIGPGLATILGNHEVFVLAFVGIVFLGERLSFRLASAILLAFGGLFLIFGLEWGEFDAPFKWGVAFGAMTALLYAAFLLVLRHVQASSAAPDPFFTVAVLSIVGSAALALYVLAGDESFAVTGAGTWLILFAYAIVCHVFGWVLISTGLPRLQTSRAGLLLLLQPALAFVWDVLFFARATTAVEVVGAVLALLAIYMGASGGNREETA